MLLRDRVFRGIRGEVSQTHLRSAADCDETGLRQMMSEGNDRKQRTRAANSFHSTFMGVDRVGMTRRGLVSARRRGVALS